MKRVFCTYFDHRYLPRGLALISSLRRHGCDDEVWVLCLSGQCFGILQSMALPGVRLLTLSDLEAARPELLRAKGERSTIEYYFTCSPNLMRHMFDRVPDADIVVYLDADLCFFSNPDLLFAEIGDAPVAITPHNYPARLKYLEKFGVYNVSIVSFRRNEEGLNCVTWWAERCLEWCRDVPQPDGRFADQGYLKWFPEVAPNLRILTHPGINLAPWNVANFDITQAGDRILVDGRPLIYFHCHGVLRRLRWFYFNLHRVYGAPLGSVLRNRVYRPYVAELVKYERLVAAALQAQPASSQTLVRSKLGANVVTLKDVTRDLMRFAFRLLDLVSGRAILVTDKTIY